MASMNKVTLIGHLGKDPEVRSLQSGNKVCNLTVATSENWKDKSSGERKEKTEWHRIVIFNENLTTIAEKYLRKGSQVYLEGSLETRKWTDNNGVEKYSTEIVLKQFNGTLLMLGNKSEQESHSPSSATHSTVALTPKKAADDMSYLDDEIPF